jgi:hypothetical protein
MSATVTFNLNILVVTRDDDRTPFLNADVQVWRGDTHVETIKLVSYADMEMPPEQHNGTVEGFAFLAARIATRHLDQHLYEVIDGGTAHRINSYEDQTNADA